MGGRGGGRVSQSENGQSGEFDTYSIKGEEGPCALVPCVFIEFLHLGLMPMHFCVCLFVAGSSETSANSDCSESPSIS